jgi:hypothetical protein
LTGAPPVTSLLVIPALGSMMSAFDFMMCMIFFRRLFDRQNSRDENDGHQQQQ